MAASRCLGLAVAERPSPKDPYSLICGVGLGGMTMGQRGVKATASCWRYEPAIPMNSEFLGRLDRKRTCDLRCWRTRRPVFSSRSAFLRSSARRVSADVRLGLSAAKRAKCCHNCCQRAQRQPLKSAENEAKMGQVGQESHLQPAVVEKAAAHSSPSDPVSPVR